jgi:hypothetical protein
MERIYELADVLLKMCIESKNGEINTQMLYTKTKASLRKFIKH